MLYLQIHQGDLSHPVGVLEEYFLKAGTSIIRAAFAHSYFIHPDDVRERTPYFAERARFSRTHYPGVGKGQKAVWQGDGREVILDDNQHAQLAWERYTGRGLLRGTGYSIRHIWGKPWDPDYFTAGWNLCYMPFWAGMLTERQHPPKSWNWPFVRLPGTCISETIRFARHPRRCMTRASTSVPSLRVSPF